MNTWGDIRSTFRAMVGDPDAYFFTAAQVLSWANRGLRDLAQYAQYRDKRIDKTVLMASEGVNLGSDVLRIWRAEGTVQGTYQALYPTTKTHLVKSYRYWFNVTGTPRNYYLDLQRASSDTVVGLYPIPASSTDFYFYCHVVPTEVSDGDTAAEVDVPNWAVASVLYYMLYQAYSADTKLQDFDRADFWKLMYDRQRDRLKQRSLSKVIPDKDWRSHRRVYPDIGMQSPEYVTGTGP